ncbi:MAG: hypothetical protein JNL70_13590 [Saprospiraceae bacterium]|nr:hypothetical protein [Saprospiraceae bacterium]
MLKKLVLVSSLFIVLLSTACKKINEALTFQLGYTSKITYNPSSSINLPFDLFTSDITTNSETEFSTRNTNKDLIDKITLKELKLTITSPTDQRFDFLSSVEVYIQATDLGELKIAESVNIPESVGNTLTLTVASNDIAPYIKKDKFKLRVKTVTDKTVSRQISVDAASQFEIQAKVL